MLAQVTTQTLIVHGAFDVPRVRANLRVQLTKAQFSPMSIGRAVTLFTGLADVIFKANGDQRIEIKLVCTVGDERNILLEGEVPGAASKLHRILEYAAPLQRIASNFEVAPQDGYLHVKVELNEG